MANIAYQQKRRLLRHLLAIEADYLVLDLSAGSSYNNLDFFALAPSGMLVTQPELPSLMNMLSFLKQHMLRRIRQEFATEHRMRQEFNALTKRSMDGSGV